MNAKQKTGLKRLLVLAKFLRKLPRKRFDYKVYVDSSWGGNQKLSCGASACALGWSATIPSLRRAGMRIVREGGAGIAAAGGDGSATGFHAGAKVFRISIDESWRLFSPDESGLGDDATPKQVAAHIEKFVARKLKEESTNA